MFAEVRRGWELAAQQPDAHRFIDAGSTSESFPLRGEAFAAQAMEALPPGEFPTIIELGAGGGRVTRWLTGYKQIYAVDIAPSMVAWLKRLCVEGVLDGNVVVPVEGDGTNLELGEVDGAYSSLVLMHNSRAAVHAIFEGLRPLVRRVAFQLPVYERAVYTTGWNQVAQWTEPEVAALADATGFVPVVIHTNPGTYARGRRDTVGPRHWDLHIFDRG